jgi:FkbM family methyltransferase
MGIRRKILHSDTGLWLTKKLNLPIYYGQNKEDKIIAQYFGDFKGTLLSIGENDGITFSNVFYFLLRGWKGDLVEPAPRAVKKLRKLHAKRHPQVRDHDVAVSNETGRAQLYRCGELLGMGETDIVASLDRECTERWGAGANAFPVNTVTFSDFMDHHAKYKHYDLISVDAELMDWEILKQMDLTALGCKCLVIEHADDKELMGAMTDHACKHGLFEIARTPENLIFTR